MVCSRPDIAHSVSVLSRFMANLGRKHWNGVKWLLRYVRGSLGVGLKFGSSKEGVGITSYVDSNYARGLDKRRTKHVDVRCHFIREIVSSGAVKLKKISIANNLVDMETKVLPVSKFRIFNSMLEVEDDLQHMFPTRRSISFAVNNNNATIEILSGSNYKRWRSDIEFVLGMMDLDMTLREDEPPNPTNESTEAMRAHYAKWEISNRLSLISIKRSIVDHLLGGIPESNNAKEFLVVVANRYQTSDNAEAGHFVDELMNMRYDDMKGVREYILKMVHLQTRLKALDIPIPDKFIVHQALNTLPFSFSQIKAAYNTLNQSWGVNDLITKCVAEEEKLKRENNESTHLVALGKPNNQKRVEKARKPNFHSHKKNKNFKKSGSEKQKNGNAKNTDLKSLQQKGSQEG
uniref:Retrovirus-related Pol polyprotein from transposon TNT 1-94 n=1 Tax=Vitis vinifera TaxID=29760 RepID=A5ACP9_VITVI|nr:hypothetical protein VITISV_038796 [Vitis vinifera]